MTAPRDKQYKGELGRAPTVTVVPGEITDYRRALDIAKWERETLRAHNSKLAEALRALGKATAPFIAGAVGSRNPDVCAAVEQARAALKGGA